MCLLCGPKNTGKSSLARHLVNDLLQEAACPEVALLDTDLGQPERGPPGFVSLSYLAQPLLLPASLAAAEPEHACFVGDVSADVHPQLFLRSVAKLLVMHWQRQGPGAPWSRSALLLLYNCCKLRHVLDVCVHRALPQSHSTAVLSPCGCVLPCDRATFTQMSKRVYCHQERLVQARAGGCRLSSSTQPAGSPALACQSCQT